MVIKISGRRIGSLLAVTSMSFGIPGCSNTSTGTTKDDTTLSGESGRLAETGARYSGPDYVVGILAFDDKTPAKVQGIGEAATVILRTQLEQAGLRSLLLDEGELRERRTLAGLQDAGEVKTSKLQSHEGSDAPDFRLSGAITAYSEVEEGVDAIVYQKKSHVARVTVDYALIDVLTGNVVISGSGAGEYRKTTTGSLGLGAKSSYDPNLRDGALRDALARSLNKMVAQLDRQPFRGVVVLIEGGSIAIRAGTRSRLSIGTQLTVVRPGQEIRDPNSGELLSRRETTIGVIKIGGHQNERVSDATVVSGSGFQLGDVARVAR